MPTTEPCKLPTTLQPASTACPACYGLLVNPSLEETDCGKSIVYTCCDCQARFAMVQAIAFHLFTIPREQPQETTP